MENTVCDFWQMIWEQGCVVIVMLTRLVENDTSMCHRYWPLEGAELYNIYEVNMEVMVLQFEISSLSKKYYNICGCILGVFGQRAHMVRRFPRSKFLSEEFENHRNANCDSVPLFNLARRWHSIGDQTSVGIPQVRAFRTL